MAVASTKGPGWVKWEFDGSSQTGKEFAVSKPYAYHYVGTGTNSVSFNGLGEPGGTGVLMRNQGGTTIAAMTASQIGGITSPVGWIVASSNTHTGTGTLVVFCERVY